MADFYGTIEGADAYNAARGNTGWAALSEAQKSAALVAGSAYVDALATLPVADRPGCKWTYRGRRTGGSEQVLMWPRDGATDADGDPIADGTVPVAVEYAAYAAAAYAGSDPSVLLPGVVASSVVVREKVDVLETQYAVGKTTGGADWANVPMLPGVQALLGGVLVMRCARYGLGIIAA